MSCRCEFSVKNPVYRLEVYMAEGRGLRGLNSFRSSQSYFCDEDLLLSLPLPEVPNPAWDCKRQLPWRREAGGITRRLEHTLKEQLWSQVL